MSEREKELANTEKIDKSMVEEDREQLVAGWLYERYEPYSYRGERRPWPETNPAERRDWTIDARELIHIIDSRTAEG